MANPAALWYLGVGAVAMYGYATGRVTNLFDNFKNKNSDSTSSKAVHSRQGLNEQRPTIIVQPSGSQRSSYLVPLGCACFIGLGGYYYYIHSNGTKKVIGKVEETAEETQTLVQQTDDNNSKRFQILDKKNEDRTQNLEIEIRSEQRAGFNVISEQLYCLTQVAIQTLSAVATSTNSASNNENESVSNEKLLGYCDKAQEMADTILSDEHMLKTKQNNLNDIKAEIQLRTNANYEQNNAVMGKLDNDYNATPGGPDSNPFDLNRNQSATIIDNNINNQQSNGEDDTNTNILSAISNGMQPAQIAYYVYENRQYVMLSSGIVFALYVSGKVVDYFSAPPSITYSINETQ